MRSISLAAAQRARCHVARRGRDAVELAELLTFLADWLSGSQRQTLADSLTAFVGHPVCDVDNLAADLHRFVFLLGLNDGEQDFGEPTL